MIDDQFEPGVALGDPAEVRFDAYPNQLMPGTLSEIASAADEKTGLFQVEVRLESAPVAPEVPNNAGSLAPITVSAPEGCLLNAKRPRAVAARHTVGHMLPDVVFGCLHQVMEGGVPAEGASSLWIPQIYGGADVLDELGAEEGRTPAFSGTSTVPAHPACPGPPSATSTPRSTLKSGATGCAAARSSAAPAAETVRVWAAAA